MNSLIIKCLIAANIFLCITENAYSSLPVDNMLFAGISLSYNDRLGHLSLSDNKTQTVARDEIPAFGVILGKRFSLPLRWRLQIPLVLDFGKVKEDAGVSFDATVKTSLLHLGLLPEIQFPLRLDSDGDLYLSFGCGLNVVRFTEENTFDFLYSSTCFSLSVIGGVGFEMLTAKNKAIAIQYSASYGKPVYYKYMKELFPFRAISYYEKILKHSLYFIVLLGK